MDYRLGSEDTRMHTITPPGYKVPTYGAPQPDGLCHAVAQDSDVAVCGATGLVLWDDPWDRGTLKRCGACLDLAPF